MEHITYHDLVARYGAPAAFDLLLQIEKLAAIRSDVIRFQEDERLQRALDALNKADCAA